MIDERWKGIRHFPGYSVSDHGRVRNDNTGHILTPVENQFKVVSIGMMRDGVQYHRSLPKLVAQAFIPHARGPFDTPINLDGNRHNNHVDNLTWRPRWFAVKYNQQFKETYKYHIPYRIVEKEEDGDVLYKNSFHCAISNGLLEKDVVMSILNGTVTWPTHQRFGVIYPDTH